MSGASSSLPPMGPPSLPVDTNSTPELTQYEPNGTPHPNSPAEAFFASVSPSRLADVPLAASEESRLPYSPSHPPNWTTPLGRNGVNYGTYLPIPMQEGEFLAWGGGSSLQRESLRGPEFRLQRLIDTIRHTLDGQRPDYASEEQFGLRRSDYAVEEQLMHGIMTSQRALEATKKNRGHAEGTTVEGSEGESEGKSKSVADFECNICLDVAKDPVVTSCGHLFCWPCLYQWLHLHCDHNECPVCKGLVIEAKVTPIYGRGGLETPVGENCGAGRGFGVEIPPRPRGSRAESLRQQLQRFMPRRLGERISTSWGHIFDEEMHGGVGYEGGRLQSFLVGVSNRLREWRMQREEGNVESGSNTAGVSDPQSNSTSSVLRDEIDNLHQPSSTDRLAAVSADLFRGLGMFVRGNSQAGASTSSVNHHTPVPPLSRPPLEATMAADQVSAPSTMAVIQGNITVNDAATEPYSAESSRRGRSSTSGSLDEGGGAFHAWKRRRMN